MYIYICTVSFIIIYLLNNNLTGLEVIQEDVHSLGFFSEISDSDTRTTNDLTGVTFTIDLAKTSPFTELLGIRNLDQVDVVFSTESFNQLDVFRFGTRLTENGQMSLTSIIANRKIQEKNVINIFVMEQKILIFFHCKFGYSSLQANPTRTMSMIDDLEYFTCPKP
jgi:hypothetical protein